MSSHELPLTMHLTKYVSLHSNRAKDSWLELVEPVEESRTKRKEFNKELPKDIPKVERNF